MRRIVVGDIHGRYDELMEVMEKSDFDKRNDMIITLGDVCDGGYQTKECLDFLCGVRNRVFVRGNHDDWFLKWIETGWEFPGWVNQGGYYTLASYDFDRTNVPDKHRWLIHNSPHCYIDLSCDHPLTDRIIGVHGGFQPGTTFCGRENHASPYILMWDRSLASFARMHPVPHFKHVFVGHTATELHKHQCFEPLTYHNLTMMDTGAGWHGKLTAMDVDTHEFWQSKRCKKPKKSYYAYLALAKEESMQTRISKE